MEAKALEQMNVKALREEAEGLGMGLPTRTKKADLLAAIQKQMAEDAEAVQAEIDAANAKIEEIAEEHEKDAERLKIPEDGPEIAPDPEPETPPAPPCGEGENSLQAGTQGGSGGQDRALVRTRMGLQDSCRFHQVGAAARNRDCRHREGSRGEMA